MARQSLPELREGAHLLRGYQRIYVREAGRIYDGWRFRKAGGDRPPWDAPNGFLKREVYRLVRHFDRAGRSDVIQSVIASRGLTPRTPTYETNKFNWGLRTVPTGAGPFLNASDLRLFANQLLYADSWDVPETYLVGFIYQLGSSSKTIHQRVAEGSPPRFMGLLP